MKYVECYTSPFEIPLQNYFLADENIGYLQKGTTEVNAKRIPYLKQIFVELKEYYALKVQRGLYEMNLEKWHKEQKYEGKIRVLEKIKKAMSERIEMYNDENVFDA